MLHEHVNVLQVRTAEYGWRDTRKQLRKDHRWDLTEQLDKDEKEKLFEVHVDGLSRRNKDMFHRLLDETDVSNSSRSVTRGGGVWE